MSTVNDSVTRRGLLKRAGLSAATISAPMVLPSGLFGKAAPSNRITLGFIGMGGQGTGRNLGTFLNQPDIAVLAVCDVRREAAENAKKKVDKNHQNSDCAACQDFREVISRRDIDAIVISTPDHWHVPLAMAALRAGKDVFCEKPTLTITEGRKLVKEVAKRKAVFQWGIEDRSLIKYHRLCGWARSGAIGNVQSIHVSLPRKKPFLKDEPSPVPEGLDWNMWLGPAPFHPHTPTRTGPQNWRNITDYSGGSLTDWGSHLVDTAQICAGMENSGPVEVSGVAGKLDPETYQSNAPVEYKVHYRYANGVDVYVEDAGPVDLRIVGTDGWVRCKGWDGVWEASSQDIIRIKEFGKEANFWPRPQIEHRDFLDSMKSRKPPAYHVEAGQRLSTTLHLGHMALHTGRKIEWDPEREAFAGGETESMNSNIYNRPARDWESA